MSTNSFKIVKGTSLKNAVLDSTWTDLRKAQDRLKTLRKSFGGLQHKTDAWLLPADEEDPKNQKPLKKKRY